MKVAKTFRLSEEAVAALDKQANATQYLEELILGTAEKKLEVVPLHTLQALLGAEFEKLGKLPQILPPVAQPAFRPSEVFVPRPPGPTSGLTCCSNLAKPCRHWQWDGNFAEYRNSLTGQTKETPDF